MLACALVSIAGESGSSRIIRCKSIFIKNDVIMCSGLVLTPPGDNYVKHM